MDVSFYLRKELLNKSGLAPIRMHMTFNGILVRKSIKGVSVKPEQWQEKRMRIRKNYKTEDYNFHIEYNQILQDLESRVEDIKRYALLNKIELTKDFVLDKLNQKQKISVEHDFFDVFDEFLESNRLIDRPNTTKNRTTIRNYLKDYVEATGRQIILAEVNLEFFEELREYSYETKKISNNYFAKIVAIVKRFMSWAEERDYHNNQVYSKFVASEHEIEVIFLDKDELMTLFNHEFDSGRLNRARDIYCFGCFTGLRFSDINNLKNAVISDGYINLNIIKTRQTNHVIPLNKFSQEILDKYEDTPFAPLPTISSQKLNDYIKECCKEVGIDKPITITRYSGNKRINTTYPKYELITSHTARKTFATLSLILGMTERFVKSVTGHKRDASFNRYVKIAEQEIKKQMENTWDKL